MAKLSVSETTTFRWSFEEDVVRYVAAGISAIGVWRQKLSDYGEEKGAELLREHGLEVSHLSWAGGFTGSDGRSFRASVDDAAEALQTAGLLGTRCLLVYSGARAGHTYNHAKRLLREALKELLPLAEQLDVALALEPVHPACAREFSFLTGMDEVLEILREFESPYLRMVLDTYHLGHSDDCLPKIPEVAAYTALVQLGDSCSPPQGEQNRCRLGEGTIPLYDIVTALNKAGYDGYYDVELLGEDLEAIRYDELLEHAQAAYARLVAK